MKKANYETIKIHPEILIFCWQFYFRIRHPVEMGCGNGLNSFPIGGLSLYWTIQMNSVTKGKYKESVQVLHIAKVVDI